LIILGRKRTWVWC